jgi:ferritin
MLHAKMEVALNKQVNAELWSGYLYLSMSYDMADKGFHGMENWFGIQAKEEFEHAEKIAAHIQAMDGKVKLEPIAEVRQEWNSPKDAFEDTLMHEKKVTGMIYNLYELAQEVKDYATANMLQWFIKEQIEEEETPRDILAAIKKIEKNEAAMYMLDKKLGKREED